MEIALQSVKLEDKSVLRNLMELYNYDFSEFERTDVDEHGLYGYDYLDHYWSEAGRAAFFIRCEGRLAGFALVRDTPVENNAVVHFLAEFFVMRKYRRLKVGQTAAGMLFNRFPGKWQLAQESANLPAQRFWLVVIRAYTGGQFQEISLPGWDGPVQEFTAPVVQKD